MVKQKLVSAIETYLTNPVSDRRLSSIKAKITRLANQMGKETGAETVRNLVIALLDVDKGGRIEWLRSRFTVESLYLEGDRVFGWHSDPDFQVQAEHLPLIQVKGSDCVYFQVHFYHAHSKYEYLQSIGFAVAEYLPLKLWGDRWEVQFRIERSEFWAQYGYALPCPLQWEWNGTGLYVLRSVICG